MTFGSDKKNQLNSPEGNIFLNGFVVDFKDFRRVRALYYVLDVRFKNYELLKLEFFLYSFV